MEELHAAAYAYYNRGNDATRCAASDFFGSMDTDGDGRISYAEFNDFVQQSGYNWILHNDPNLFAKLDRNRDGGLDFEEVLTFYYIIKTRYITCQGCKVHLCGLYFTCVDCFDEGFHHHDPTYDLCTACYGHGNYIHEHSYFLDNHVLLRSKRGTHHAPPNLTLALAQAQPAPQIQQNPLAITNNYYVNQAAPQNQRNRWYQALQAFQALESVLSFSALASNCTIM